MYAVVPCLPQQLACKRGGVHIRTFNTTGDSAGIPGARNNDGGLSSHQGLVG